MYNHFLISSKSKQERNALSEAYEFLKSIFHENKFVIKANPLKIRGLGLINLVNGPLNFPPNFKINLIDIPFEIKFLEKIVPIQVLLTNCKSLASLIDGIKPYFSFLPPDKKWKVNVSKRHSKLKGQEIIEQVVKEIPNPNVDLSNPEWIIQIEILQNWFGFSILPKNHIISFVKLKQSS